MRLLFLLLFLGNLISVQAQTPTITSVTPGSVCQGKALTIIGTNFTGVTSVQLGSSNAAGFVVNSTTNITAYVSLSAGNGPVEVTTPDGTASGGSLTILPVPQPELIDISTKDLPFTNCNGDATYLLKVSNNSIVPGSGNKYQISWGDNTPVFSQTDWPVGDEITHKYTAQGYFPITITITPNNGCGPQSKTYLFYSGENPIASFTTTLSTTGLCVPAPVEFQIGNWFKNTPGTRYEIDFGDGSQKVTLQQPLESSDIPHKFSHTYSVSSCPSADFTATLFVINGCYTTIYTLNQIIIRQKPKADFSIKTNPLCINEPVCFTNQTVSGYSGTSCTTAGTFLWEFGDGTTSTQENPPCHQYPGAGSYTIKLTATNTACGDDTKSKTIVISDISPPPAVSATPIIYCEGEVATQLTATGTALLWYTSATGGTGSPTAPVPPTNRPGVLTYYVTQTLPNKCESIRVPLKITINGLPNAPATRPLSLCQNQVAGPLTATGTGLLWYTVETGGSGTVVAPTPSTSTIGSTTYYVSQTTNNCEGPRASLQVTVNALAVAPVVTSPITYCQYQTPQSLTAGGTNLRWYTSATGGIGSAVAPVPSTSAFGNTVYYVSQLTGCGESPRASITVIVNPAPSATISYSPVNLCNSSMGKVAVTFTGTTGGSYTVSPSGLTIDPVTGEINPLGAAANTYTVKYTVTGTGGCNNFVTTATVTVSGAPTATITYPAICSADAPTRVTLTGSQGGAFSAPTGVAIDAVTGTIIPANSTPGSYKVTYAIAAAPPCAGLTTTADITITRAPSATISYSPASLCNTSTTKITATLAGTTGGTYSISPLNGLTINSTSGEIDPFNATTGMYTIKYTVKGTGGCANFNTTTTVTVSSVPKATITYPAICSADAPTRVTLTGSQGGAFSAPTGVAIDAVTGTITPANSTPGSYKVTYAIAAAPPCAGFSTTADITITKAPSATISYSPASVCNASTTKVTPAINGTTGGVYSITPTGLTINSTSGEIDPFNATAGMYTIKYTVKGTGGCADLNTTTTVTVSSAPTASINYPGTPYCGAITIPQPVSLTGTRGGTFTSRLGLSINAATGDINPVLSTPGVYTVTYTITALPPCPGYVTTTSVTIEETPVVSFPINQQSICSGETATFTPSSTVVNTTYTWSVIGALPPNVNGISNGSFSSNMSLSFTNTGTVSQSLTIRVIPTSRLCPGKGYDLTLIVKPATPAPITDTVHLCMGAPPQALHVDGTSIKWYDANPLNAAPIINTSVAKTFIYYVTQTNSYGCESPKSEIVAIVHPTAKIISSSYVNPTTCGIPSGAIILNVLDLNNDAMPNIPVIVHYNKFQIPHTILSNTDNDGKITIPLTAGTYSDIYVETSGACPSAKIPDVFILKDPSPPAQPVAGYNPPICSETPLTLTALTATGTQAGPINYVWAGPAFGPFADTVRTTVISFPSASAADEGTYVVYAIQNNCISLPTSFEVTINQSPEKPFISTRTPLCVGDHLVLQASSSIPGNSTLNYSWQGPGAGFPVNAPNAAIDKVSVQDAGIYSVTVTSTETGCSATSDTLIQIGDYPIVQFAQDTLTLPTGYRMNLVTTITNATEPGVLPIQSYTWTPLQDLECNDALCSLPIASIKNNICYTVKVTNIYGCSGSDNICVQVFCKNSQVFIPNAFAPNGNVPENKKLIVRATGISSVKSFRVFNRWGKILYERSNFPPNSADFGWDGKVNGKMADTGVYIYTVDVICENGIPYTFKGNVTLF
jgi:gliding motility-associated-like protein